jgi:uncharacterized membrane protein SpoIIM required for sporulation
MLYRTKTDRFVAERREQWQFLENLQKRSSDQWSPLELKEFPSRYRALSNDLALARAEKLSPEVVDYINNLLGQCYIYLYQNPEQRKKSFSRYLFQEVPAHLRRNWGVILLSFLLFSGSFALGVLIDRQFPEFRPAIAQESTLESVVEMHRVANFGNRSSDEAAEAAAWYVNHNGSIALLSFVTGIFLGLGSVYFLIYNGLFLGVLISYVLESSSGPNLLKFIIAHASFELIGLVIAGAAGLLIGKYFLWPGDRKRKEVFWQNRKEILALVLFGVFCIGMAAFIEGVITPMGIGIPSRIAIAGGSLGLILLMFFAGVGHKKELSYP